VVTRFTPNHDETMSKEADHAEAAQVRGLEGCNAVIEGKDEAEVMAKGAEHAKAAHKMTTIPPEMAAKVKAAIKEKK
jgi:predicted small metal-binding protein